MKKIAIIVSEKDAAGMNIREKLISREGFVPSGRRHDGNEVFSAGPVAGEGSAAAGAMLYTLKNDTVFSEDLDRSIEADVMIFATRHQAASGTSTLSVHVPGNFGAADFGGESGWLCAAPACLMKKALMTLKATNSIAYDVTMEATHHGPRLEKPAMFIEIGSSERQWADDSAGQIIAAAVKRIAVSDGDDFIPAAGIGGPHYCTPFNGLVLDSRYAIGHVCPKYNADRLDAAMIRQMAEKTVPKTDLFVIDWKGLQSARRSLIIEMIEKLGYRYIRA